MLEEEDDDEEDEERDDDEEGETTTMPTGASIRDGKGRNDGDRVDHEDDDDDDSNSNSLQRRTHRILLDTPPGENGTTTTTTTRASILNFVDGQQRVQKHQLQQPSPQQQQQQQQQRQKSYSIGGTGTANGVTLNGAHGQVKVGVTTIFSAAQLGIPIVKNGVVPIAAGGTDVVTNNGQTVTNNGSPDDDDDEEDDDDDEVVVGNSNVVNVLVDHDDVDGTAAAAVKSKSGFVPVTEGANDARSREKKDARFASNGNASMNKERPR